MKTKKIFRSLGSIIMIMSLFILSSCSKPADEVISKDEKDGNTEAASIGDKDISETDEDLSTVDYREFYDQLSPHGEWIQVRSGEIGLKPNTARSESGNPDDCLSSLSSLIGVKEAKANEVVNENMVFVWKPAASLGVSVVPGESPVFTPYTNGQWVNTDAGWYFKAPTPEEETVSHFGRWVNSPTAGWLWVPGRVWAPAWVDWKQNADYVSWAPLPPSVYLTDNVIKSPVINDNEYVIVDKKYFLEPAVYKYNALYYKGGSPVLIKDLSETEGIVVINNTVNNIGPDIKTIQNIYGGNIELVKLHHVKKYNEVTYSSGHYYVYSPDFRKFTSKGKKRTFVNMPKSYREYDEWNVRNSEGKGSEQKNKNDGKDNNKNMKKGNNGDMHNGNNGDMHKGNNGDMHNGNMNNEKHDLKNNGDNNRAKEDGGKSNGKENGNKNNGKNKGKGKK
ncbi:MAG: hypothetical protein JSS91_05120 [Bacteroidetes bacterium]|nr:hypothetical protein [Bacteroidota bacterium]